MKVTSIQAAFVGGEISPRLDGRVDIAKYKNSCRTIENMIVVPHGGARKRSGTKFVVEQPNADDVAMIPFQFNIEQSYVLMFGPNYVWFFKDRGIVTHSPVAITAAANGEQTTITAAGHGLAVGDHATLASLGGAVELNNRCLLVTAVSGNTVTLQVNSVLFTAYTSGGTIAKVVKLITPYVGSEVADIQTAQSADVLYVVHPNHPIYKISRFSHTSWTLTELTFTTGPFRPINPDREVRIKPSSFSSSPLAYGTYPVGTVCTLTLQGATLFVAGHVGALIRLTEDGGETGIASAPVGDSTRTLAAGNVYTFDSKIYGVAGTDATNWQKFTRVPGHTAGRVRVLGDGKYFDSDFLHPGYCVLRITGVTSSTVCTAQIVRYQMPASVATGGTSFWEEGSWSLHRGYPRATTFYEQRLWFAGVLSDPVVVWSSRSGAYEDMEDGPDDDDALIYRLTAGQSDVIRWLSGGRVLTAGSSQGEYVITASSQGEALTPKNVKAVLQTTYGTSQAQPVRVNQQVFYPQRSGISTSPARKLRKFGYALASDAYESTDLTVFAEHITGAGFDRVAYQVEPESIVWTRRTDGHLAACTLEESQEVVAWHRHILGGGGLVKTFVVIPGEQGDDLWLSVERVIDGQTRRYIEVLNPPFRPGIDAKEDARILDCALMYVGPSTVTISGLNHIEGERVTVLSNGSVERDLLVTGGKITLSRATTKAQIGYRIASVIETEDFESGAQAGTAQSRHKRINKAFVRVLESLGGSVGPDADNQNGMQFRSTYMPTDVTPPLFSGLVEVDFPGNWDRGAVIRIEHNDPLPLFVTGVTFELNTTG